MLHSRPCPKPVGPEVDYLAKRTLAFSEHADAEMEVREWHRRCGLAMIAHEVRIMDFDGFSARLAEVAAKNNLAVRLKVLDGELEADLGRLQAELGRWLQRLLEDLEDSTTE